MNYLVIMHDVQRHHVNYALFSDVHNSVKVRNIVSFIKYVTIYTPFPTHIMYRSAIYCIYI